MMLLARLGIWSSVLKNTSIDGSRGRNRVQLQARKLVVNLWQLHYKEISGGCRREPQGEIRDGRRDERPHCIDSWNKGMKVKPLHDDNRRTKPSAAAVKAERIPSPLRVSSSSKSAVPCKPYASHAPAARVHAPVARVHAMLPLQPLASAFTKPRELPLRSVRVFPSPSHVSRVRQFELLLVLESFWNEYNWRN